jgi:hypothetical protein
MPGNARVILLKGLLDASRWLEELLSDPRMTLESLASREGRTVRSIRMTLSLAFLSPEIVKAAVEGRLPRGFGLKRLVDADGLAGSVAHARTPGASVGVRNDPPRSFVFRRRADPIPPTGSKCRGSKPKGRSRSGAVGTYKQQPWKRNFCRQRLSTARAPMSRKDGGMDLADRLMPSQVAEISSYSANQEITSICADFLVELRGIEPLTSAVRLQRSPI